MLKELHFTGFDGRDLVYYESKVNSPRAIVVVVHGMQEHAKRYDWFMAQLASNGIMSVAMDLRGHGKNILEVPGFDKGDIYLNIVKDIYGLINAYKSAYPGVRIVLFGHSYGSFVVQRFVRDYPNLVDKFVVCGSSHMNNLLIKSARIIAGITKLFKGAKAEAKLVEKLSIRGYGKGFSGGNWLTRDEKIWEQYKADPLCGCAFPASFYVSMFKNLVKNYKGLNKSDGAPILLIAGDDDPVGNYGKGVKKLYKTYKSAGKNVQMILYPEARHEVLNEVNKGDVVKDVLTFVLG